MGVHQARVASRRLREAVPVLAGETKSRQKARRRFGGSPRRWAPSGKWTSRSRFWMSSPQATAMPRDALEDVRGARHRRARSAPRRHAHRLRRVNTDQIRARLEEASIVAARHRLGEWREALAARVAHRAKRLARGHSRGGSDLRGRAAARGPHRHQEAALRAGAGRRLRGWRPSGRSSARSSARRRPSAACTICRSSSSMWRRCRRCRRRGGVRTTAGSKVIARQPRGRVPASPRPLHQAGPGAARTVARDVQGHASCRNSRVDAPPPLKMTLRARSRVRRGEAGLTVATLELYLIRHGIAAERGPEYPDDSKRPLTGKGITALKQEAKALNALGDHVRPDHHSPLTRTRQTAESSPTPEGEADRRAQRFAGAGRHAGRGHAGDREALRARRASPWWATSRTSASSPRV